MNTRRRPADRRETRSSSWPPETVLGMLRESERDGLLSLGVLREWATGSTLLMEGDTRKHVLVLDAGWVKVVAQLEEGGQALLALRSRGDLVGEQAAVEDAPRSASVVSAIPVRAYVIQREPFLKYLRERPDVHLAVTQTLSAKLRSETRRRVDFGILNAEVRLARVLCDLARRNSRPTDEGIELGYTLTQPELAAMIGISEPSLQRALRKLRELGVVSTGYRRIIIRDMAKLERIARPGLNGGQDAIR
jgi:CRP/FNR family cyclic AMP-dependent transcriptional regulator